MQISWCAFSGPHAHSDDSRAHYFVNPWFDVSIKKGKVITYQSLYEESLGNKIQAFLIDSFLRFLYIIRQLT